MLQLAAVFGGGGSADVVFSLDRMAIALEDAQKQVASLSEQLTAAESRETELTVRADALAQRGRAISTSSSPTGSPRRRTPSRPIRNAPPRRAEVERLRTELEQAQATLEAARTGAHSASFTPAAAAMLRMPTRADGYVFPVGGGAGFVSVGHHHHDYPAADIAAPAGAPVFALTDAVVLALIDDGRCGTGLSLRSLDGLEWVYCHLSFRDPGVQAGRARHRRAVGWARRLDRPLDRTAPPPRAEAGPLPAGDALVPGVRRARVHVAGRRSLEPAVRTTPIFSLVPAGEADQQAEDVVQFTLEGG